MGEENPRDMSMLIILATFTVPVILWYIWYIWISTKNWLDKVDNLNTDNEYINKYAYINKSNDKKTKVYTKEVKQADRERPPNASFFSRVDGKETFIEGPYEEQFLNRYETVKWKFKERQKKLKEKVTKL